MNALFARVSLPSLLNSKARMVVSRMAGFTACSLLVLTVLIYACLWLPELLPPPTSSSSSAALPVDLRNPFFTAKKYVEKDELDMVLEETSMKNKMLIIAVLNKAYVGKDGMLELFLRSLREGEKTGFLKDHLLLVAVDEEAFDQCKALGLHCYRLTSDGDNFSKEVFYMSDKFIRMMWRRTQFLRDVLRRGYSFIFTDMDVLWLRNPLTRLNGGGEDLQISCDNYNPRQPLNASLNLINTGFYLVRSNERTVALFDRWYGAMNRSRGMKDQDVLLEMNFDGVFARLGMRVKYLDTNYFSGFCQKSRDLRKVITVHANCCIGTDAKLVDLRAFFEAWKIQDGTANASWPAHRTCLLSKDRKLVSV